MRSHRSFFGLTDFNSSPPSTSAFDLKQAFSFFFIGVLDHSRDTHTHTRETRTHDHRASQKSTNFETKSWRRTVNQASYLPCLSQSRLVGQWAVCDPGLCSRAKQSDEGPRSVFVLFILKETSLEFVLHPASKHTIPDSNEDVGDFILFFFSSPLLSVD